MSKRLSVRVNAMGKVARREQRAAVKDIGRFARDLARKNAVKGLRPYIVMTEPKDTEQTIYVEVGTNSKIVIWNERGTGLYGPRGDYIRPKKAKVLAWKVTGGRKGMVKIASGISRRKGKTIKMSKRDVYMVFALKVRGIKPRKFMERAFNSSELASYRRRRIREMKANIQAAGKS